MEIAEDTDYGNTDINALINSDRVFNNYEESYGDMGYQKQEFSSDGELVSAEGEKTEDADDDYVNG